MWNRVEARKENLRTGFKTVSCDVMEKDPGTEGSIPVYDGNPFWRRSRPVEMSTVLKFLFGFILAPARIVMCSMAVVVATTLCRIILLGAPKLQMYEPMDKTRRHLLQGMLRYSCRFVLYMIGAFDIEEDLVEDTGAPSERGDFVLVSNHVSFVDIFYLIWRFSPSFVSKAEVKNIPGISTLAKGLQCIFVDRTDGKTPSATKQIQERLHIPGFSATLVFPEATTSNNESILPFRTGAFVSGAPVKIVCFSYESYDFDPCYCGLGPLVLWTMLCEPVLRLKVRSLPLYHPSEEERKDPTLYAQNVRIEMHKVTGLPFSELSFADRVDRNLSRENLNVKKLT